MNNKRLNPYKPDFASVGILKQKFSFTLIELLIVIAIITILAAMLLPALSLSKEQARKSNCLVNLKQIGMGMIMYADQYEEYPRINPPDGSLTYNTANFPNNADVQSIDGLAFFNIEVPGPESLLWRCPSSAKSPAGTTGAAAGNIRLFADNGTPANYTDDIQNYALMTNWKGQAPYDTPGGGPLRTDTLSPTNVKDPQGPLVGDCITTSALGVPLDGPHKDSSGFITGMNQVYSDGHGEWYPRTTVEANVQWDDNNGNIYFWLEE